ncbi:tRNA threonylcarbamoyladenosine biosynthesis protein TsaE [Novipirellula galeiformis]|uniref:tRNA threonylcarbamoyladenosine biosynthesis protein TsaE n=1 Tax=Novipirellula galeiformis TaxID=2528004 RepID=A0A5C6CJK7_9BACT|nr:tRNA (adenosine(37)-N6)-threonylcarbamoyltransferase complex ATPase subunit type 1 TsaE [Novipirellula galeiformis]TWU25033.1 tRNA threonylcarbamoyladenosine biosynthesis protein TsaE [Novipirellula galeiformis]
MGPKRIGKLALSLRHLDLPRIDTLAGWMVRAFRPGMTFGFIGTLGAGKTRFVQAIALAAGIEPAEVTSPTFTLLQTHQGAIKLHHLDAYRVADDDEFLELGVEELFDDVEAWTLVEWADLVSSVMPLETLWIQIEIGDDPNLRQVSMFTNDESLREAFGELEYECRSAGWALT